jgi:hypothetical protein
MTRLRSLGVALALAVAAACARGSDPDRCEVRIVRLDEWRTTAQGLDVAYVVSGAAGSRGKVWLAGKKSDGTYISGKAREVGPGEFQEVVKLRLTGRVPEYAAVLELPDTGRRCKDETDEPKR